MSNFASITYHVYTCMLYWYCSLTHCHHHNDVRLVKYIELEGFWKEMSILVVPIAACMYGTQCRDPTLHFIYWKKLRYWCLWIHDFSVCMCLNITYNLKYLKVFFTSCYGFSQTRSCSNLPNRSLSCS